MLKTNYSLFFVGKTASLTCIEWHRDQHAATETYFIAENTLTSLSFLIERIWLGNVSLTHNYPWLTKEPKHSLERSFGGEWHETAWVCGQPFFDDRSQSMEWSRGKEKCWSVGMSLMLRYRALSLSPDSFCFQLRTSVLVILVICRPLPWLLPFCFFDLTLPTSSFLLMYPEWSVAFSIVSVEPWCGNRLAVCVLHIACSQRSEEKERAKQQPQVWPVCRMPGLFSGWQPPTHQGYIAVIRWEEMLEIPNSKDRARYSE